MGIVALPGGHRGGAGTQRAPRPVLVVVAGLPGSGKTTLLRRLSARGAPGVRFLDAEQVSARLRTAGLHVPYRWLRPLVHGVHRWRVLREVAAGTPVVVLTDPWTGSRWPSLVRTAARRAGRAVHVVLLDTSPELAGSGQVARGRTVPPRRMRRHAERWRRLVREPGPAGADRVVVVDREGAQRLTLEAVLAPPCPPVPAPRVG
ncbi:hypothetical protein NUM3379_27680 [Kineococcus sp. NUM-3379]